MKIDAQTIISEYYEQVKDQYPDLTFTEFEKICQAPFVFLKKEMEEGNLPTVRFQYFGTFLVYPKRVTALLSKLEVDFKSLKIGPKIYFKKKEILSNFLKRIGYEY